MEAETPPVGRVRERPLNNTIALSSAKDQSGWVSAENIVYTRPYGPDGLAIDITGGLKCGIRADNSSCDRLAKN